MRNTKRIIAITVGLIIFSTVTVSPAFADTELWTNLSVKKSITPFLSFYFKPEMRFKSEMQNHYYSIYCLGPIWELNRNIELGLLYAYKLQLQSNQWTSENRYILDGTYKWIINTIKLDIRNRFEYRSLLENWVYRNRSRVQLKAANMTPYIFNEAFYSFKDSIINENRISIGIIYKGLPESFSLDLGYMLRGKGSESTWTNSNILILGIKKNF